MPPYEYCSLSSGALVGNVGDNISVACYNYCLLMKRFCFLLPFLVFHGYPPFYTVGTVINLLTFENIYSSF